MAPLFTERAATSVWVKDSRDGRNTIINQANQAFQKTSSRTGAHWNTIEIFMIRKKID